MREDRQLSPAEQDAFGAELDALRNRTLADLGAADARYIRRIRRATRLSALAGRLLLLAGWFPPTWLLGSLLLGLAKILDNMELGHNVMHGQWDWMNDPEIHSTSWEWDNNIFFPREALNLGRFIRLYLPIIKSTLPVFFFYNQLISFGKGNYAFGAAFNCLFSGNVFLS